MSKNEKDEFLISNLKAMLQEKLWLIDERFTKKRMATSYKALTRAESRILSALRGEALTISEVGRRLGLSRQAVHKTVSNLVDAKLLKLEPIPDNSRDKRIIFTEKGEAMKSSAHKALQEIEKEVEAEIGKKNFKLLKSLLKKPW